MESLLKSKVKLVIYKNAVESLFCLTSLWQFCPEDQHFSLSPGEQQGTDNYNYLANSDTKQGRITGGQFLL